MEPGPCDDLVGYLSNTTVNELFAAGLALHALTHCATERTVERLGSLLVELDDMVLAVRCVALSALREGSGRAAGDHGGALRAGPDVTASPGVERVPALRPADATKTGVEAWRLELTVRWCAHQQLPNSGRQARRVDLVHRRELTEERYDRAVSELLSAALSLQHLTTCTAEGSATARRLEAMIAQLDEVVCSLRGTALSDLGGAVLACDRGAAPFEAGGPTRASQPASSPADGAPSRPAPPWSWRATVAAEQPPRRRG